MAKKQEAQKDNSIRPRPPVVVILGHVDHGKTSILDYIRHSKVAQKESGGITQHVGAYQVILPPEAKSSRGGRQADEGYSVKNDLAIGASRRITFIDTPGHEAFSAIRSRGAKVADIAILVVAADEGVKPQTKEAISHILRLELPLIVAMNKMDKPAALPDKVRKELADNNVLVESLGGQVPEVLVSAKTGLNIDALLEMILLVAEMEEISADIIKPARGVIIESRADAQRGATATLLVQEGILTNKDIVAAESAFGALKVMEDFTGSPIVEAGPSTPVIVTGFNLVPPVGEEWQAIGSLDMAREKTSIKAQQEKRKREPVEILDLGANQKILNIILKADASGSLEAIRESLKAIPAEEIIIRVIKAEMGDISENDLKMAALAKAKIYGFRIKSSVDLDLLAERQQIKLKIFDIIYELVQAVREDASKLLAPEVIKKNIGRLRVLGIFGVKKDGQIIGGRVASGHIERGAIFEVKRGDELLGEGRITQLQINKENAAEATKDKECGLLVQSDVTIEKNDILEAYKEERKKREL